MKRLILLIVALCGICGAQTDAFMPMPRQEFTNNGAPLSGGFLYTYAAGTSTPLATYHIDTLGSLVANTNPVILDVNGSAEVRLLPQAYKMVLQDSNNNQIWAIDQIQDFGQLALASSVLLNPPGAALQTIAGPLAFTTLSLNSGTPLTTTNQSGTGILCMTTNCALATPSINGITIPNSPGTYIQVPNSTTGTTLNTLTKFAAATPSWTKRNDQTGSGTGSPQTATAFSTSLTNPSLIVVLTSGPVGTFTVTDTAGNTYVDCGPGQIVFNSSANGVQCFYALNTHTTASNVVSFASTGGGAMKVTATEWTGAAIVTPVDVTQNSGANQSTGSGGGQNVTSGAATTTGADLVVGITGVATGTLTVGTGFTTSSTASLEYLTQSGPGALAATWNDNTNSDSYAAIMVAFRPYAGTTSFATSAVITDTSGIQGITVSGAGNAGNAVIQQSGTALCVFDGPTNASDYVQISATVAGDCHDTGVITPPTSGGQVIGHVLSTNAGAGAYGVELLGPEFPSGSGAGTVKTVCAQTLTTLVDANVTTFQPIANCVFPNGSLNTVGKTFRLSAQINSTALSGTASAYLAIGTTSSLGSGNFAVASVAATTSWTLSFDATCTVSTTGTAGLLYCSVLPVATGGATAASGGTKTTFTLNITGAVYAGYGCGFSAASTGNTCTGSQLIIEQLN